MTTTAQPTTVTPGALAAASDLTNEAVQAITAARGRVSDHCGTTVSRNGGGALFAVVRQWSCLAGVHEKSRECDDGDRTRIPANDEKGCRKDASCLVERSSVIGCTNLLNP